MTVTIDRFEGELAVLEHENGEPLELPRLWLPDNAKEGDMVAVKTRRNSKTGAVSVRFIVDPEATLKRREDALRLREVIKKGPAGDLSL